MAPAVAGSAAAAGCPNADLVPTAANVDKVRASVLCLTNADRAQRGMARLKENPKLRMAARAHSSDMVDKDYFGHTTPGGESFVDRIVDSGYVRRNGDWSLGENLGWGSGELGTARGVQDAWMHSRGHKANVLKSAYREIGIGVSTDAGAGATFTINFGVKR